MVGPAPMAHIFLALPPGLRQIRAHRAVRAGTHESHPVLATAFFSSGDVIADRRADYARMLAGNGEHEAAAELMGQALERAPDWAAGWDLLGSYHDKAGNIAAAIAAWRRLEALDDAGVFGARLKLAAHAAGAAGQGTALGYVEALFDQYAPQFEASLLGRLGYRVPEMLAQLVAEHMALAGLDGFERALDLGCGTGLMGERLRGAVDQLEGIDISAAMIAETARKGIYDRLQKAELVAALNARRSDLDLVTAADVFIYCGALEPVLAALVPALKPGGLAAFSLEAHEGEEAVFLRPSLRYAHGVAATRAALAGAGLDIVRFETAVLRFDRGAPVSGLLILAQRPAVAVAAANETTAGGDQVA